MESAATATATGCHQGSFGVEWVG